jgi:hypothetical protein
VAPASSELDGPLRDELFQAAADSAKSVSLVTIPDADHGYGFYSNQPAVDAMLHGALVSSFGKALR